MNLRSTARTAAAGAGAAVLGITLASPATAATGITYVEPVNGAQIKVLATSGDTMGGVMWPGTPDGIGVLKDGDNLTVFINHELSVSEAAVRGLSRAGGAAAGSTVSALNLNGDATSTTAFRDVLTSVKFWDYQKGTYASAPTAPTGAAKQDSYGTPYHTINLNRFCSSHMAQPGDLAFTTTVGGKSVTYGYTGPAYFTGEEGGDESRAFVMDNKGSMVQLPKLGLAGWENFLPSPVSGRRTVIMADEDNSATNSQLWMYIGEKETTGEWYEKAGLTNGQAYVAAVNGVASDNAYRSGTGKNASVPVTFRPVDTTVSGTAQNAQAQSLGTIFSRIEDGAWDPQNPNDYYFITTESNKDAKATAPNPASPTISRDGGALWRLRFADVTDPLGKGAMLTMLLDGTEAPYLNKPDNLDVDAKGNILIQEDPGNNDHISRVVAYRIADGKIGTVAKFVDSYFTPGSPSFITKDEETSGITNITSFVRKGESDTNEYYLFDAQVHVPTAQARPDATAAEKAAMSSAVEGGQLYLLTIPSSAWATIYR